MARRKQAELREARGGEMFGGCSGYVLRGGGEEEGGNGFVLRGGEDEALAGVEEEGGNEFVLRGGEGEALPVGYGPRKDRVECRHVTGSPGQCRGLEVQEAVDEQGEETVCGELLLALQYVRAATI
jgi:hypothetical protein